MKPIIAFLALITTASNAATIISFTFDTTQDIAGNTGTLSPNSVHQGLTGTVVSFGAGADEVSNPSNTSPGSNLNRNLNLAKDAAGTGTAEEARLVDSYMQFSVTVGVGHTLDLRNQDLSFLATKGGGTNNRSVIVDVSLDGFSTYETLGEIATPTTSTAFETFTRSLPDLAVYDGITGGTTVTFRFYEFADGDVARQSVKLDDIVVNGLMIPEPGVMILGALAIPLVLRRAVNRR